MRVWLCSKTATRRKERGGKGGGGVICFLLEWVTYEGMVTY